MVARLQARVLDEGCTGEAWDAAVGELFDWCYDVRMLVTWQGCSDSIRGVRGPTPAPGQGAQVPMPVPVPAGQK